MSPLNSSKKLAHANSRLIEETRKMLAPSNQDSEVFEVRPDGMRISKLLTFSFYAPWVRTTQLNASKREADSIRLKVSLTFRISATSLSFHSNYSCQLFEPTHF